MNVNLMKMQISYKHKVTFMVWKGCVTFRSSIQITTFTYVLMENCHSCCFPITCYIIFSVQYNKLTLMVLKETSLSWQCSCTPDQHIDTYSSYVITNPKNIQNILFLYYYENKISILQPNLYFLPIKIKCGNPNRSQLHN